MAAHRLLDSRVALVGATALATALTLSTAAYLLRPLLLAANSPDKPDEEETKKKDDEEKKDEKRYETKKEFYSPVTGMWEVREAPDEDKTK
jgi:hypothetical protein